MNFNQRPFQQILADIANAQDEDDLNSILDFMVDCYGLQHANYHIIKSPGLNKQLMPITTIQLDWISHYFKKSYQAIDPLVMRTNGAPAPVNWNHVDRKSGEAGKLYKDATNAGIGNYGISFPFQNRAGHRVVFAVISEVGFGSRTELVMRDMQYIGDALHRRILSMRGDLGKAWPTKQLSQLELECLKWASEGKSTDETADTIKQSTRFVRFCLDQARLKLDCLTKTQAVAAAIRLGLID